MNTEKSQLRGWWTMSGECFIEALRQAHAGEDPEMVYAEWYANSDVEHVAGGDDA